MLPILPTYNYDDEQRRIDEEAAIAAADTIHLDNEPCSIYIDSIWRESPKAYLCRIGYWRSNNIRQAWGPKSQIEFTQQDLKESLIPIWLVKRICITIRTTVLE